MHRKHNDEEGVENPECEPPPEDFGIKEWVIHALMVIIEAVFNENVGLKLFIDDCIDYDGAGSIENVEDLVDYWFVEGLAWEVVENPEPKLGHHQEGVFEEVIEDEGRVPAVAFPAMVEKQTTQKTELADRVVAGSCCLKVQSLASNLANKEE